LFESLFDREGRGGWTAAELSRRLKVSSNTASKWALYFGVKLENGWKKSWTARRRLRSWKFNWNKVNWKKRDCDIAKKFSVSRERVRQMRKRFAP
jgi:hypothetical protein